MSILTIDFETRSAADLKAVGVYHYASHPTTQVLCLALKERGADPVVWMPDDILTPDVRFAATASGLPYTAVDGDIRDDTALSRAASGCEAVIHMAAKVAVWARHPGEFDEINVGGLKTVLRVAASLGVSRVVYTSSFLALPPAGARAPQAWNDYSGRRWPRALWRRAPSPPGSPSCACIPASCTDPGR